MWRDAEPNAVPERGCNVFTDALEPLQIGPEDLEIHDCSEAEIGTGGRRRAAEAAVPDRGDPRPEALERAQPGDRLHLLELDPALPLDVQRDPGPEREPVAEAGVGRVLEMRMGVHEAGEDHCIRESLTGP